MRRRIEPNRQGLTLIEIIIAISIGSIIFLATALIMVPVQKSWDRTMMRANVQRNASFAMLAMKRSIITGTRVELDADGEVLTVHRDTGWIKFRYEPTEKTLLYQFEGQDEQTLVLGTVEAANFYVNNNSVTVNIELEKDGYVARLLTTTTMRNYKT
jgi:prepilin-type N-terminal cleavage/methylation domain-containing protein